MTIKLKDIWSLKVWAFVISIMTLVMIPYLVFCFSQAQANPEAVNGVIKVIGGVDILMANMDILMAILAIVTITAVCIVVRGLNSVLNNRSIAKVSDRIMADIPACSDQEIIELNDRLGVTVNEREVVIPEKIFNAVSVNVLAKNISWLLYLNYDGVINLIRRGQYSAVHSLADLMLDHWNTNRTIDFIDVLKNEKEYLGDLLEAAVSRRSLEREVELLRQQIESCCNQEQMAIQGQGKIERSLEDCLISYSELRDGKSAFISGVKKSCAKLLKNLHLKKQ